MNIHGNKLKLKKARIMLRDTEEEIPRELGKNPRKRDYDKIERLNLLIKNIKSGMQNLRNNIRVLRQERKKKKK